ncbi:MULTISPECIES: hypothetical protein [Flavobacteriaceae]|uniref:hypothetical protein n=1 Tax=Flavobacteriaceae TaxID=49546 RepID=UPI001491EAC8|nr:MULTISPECIES: hypothetical protein [Allomuricauda]MDC6365562.1 hypothetical protein [Muricauda sp. AC10]
MNKLLSLLASVFLFSCGSIKEDSINHKNQYVGRYLMKPDFVVEIYKTDSVYKILPSFWKAARTIDSVNVNEFTYRDNTRILFERDSTDKIVAVKLTGHHELEGIGKKLGDNDIQPVEFLLSGRIDAAIEKMKNNINSLSEERIIGLSFSLLKNYPSKAEDCLRFASAFETLYPNSVDLHQVIGLANLLAENRQEAKIAFEKAYALDKENSLSYNAVRLLGSLNVAQSPKNAWKLPFNIDSLFAPPTKTEIETVLTSWQNRNLSVSNAEIVKEDTITLEHVKYHLKIIKHLIDEKKHFGAVLIPIGAKLRKSPVIIEARGVDPLYSPKDLVRTEMYVILENNKNNCIIAIPSFRGNTLIWNNEEFHSEGDPTNAWDGATDDAIAFLNVVLEVIPESDPNRIASFGMSRGGTVAMLMGIRDPRVKSVVAWAGPSGWFDYMGTFGWTIKDQVKWGLWEKWTPNNGWGSSAQFIEWFLKPTIETGTPGLSRIRQNILASSPLYFLDSLPTAQLHYGKEDRYVPYKNALVIKEILDKNTDREHEIYIHENTGHDQPYPKAYLLSKEFFEEMLKDKK